MRRIWALADKDLLQTRRDKLAALFILVMPLAFTLFLGLIFGGEDGTTPMAVANQDEGGEAATQLVEGLRASPVVVVERMGGRSWRSRSTSSGWRRASSSRPATRTRWRGQAGDADARARRRLERRPDGRERDTGASSPDGPSSARAATAAAGAVAAAYGRVRRRRTARAPTQTSPSADSLDAPAFTVRTVSSGSAEGEIPSGFDLTSTGMIVNFVLFSTMTAGIALIMERRSGTLQRLMTTRRDAWRAHRRQGARHVHPHLHPAGPTHRHRRPRLRGRLLQRPGRAPPRHDRSLGSRVVPSVCCLPRCSGQRTGAHRRVGPDLDGVAAHLGRLVPARDHRPDLLRHRTRPAHRLDPRRPARHRRHGFDVADVLPAFWARSSGRRGSS